MSGGFTSYHLLKEPSYGFAWVLRSPFLQAIDHALGIRYFFAHSDIVGIAIFITSDYGFQGPKEDAEMFEPDKETKEC
jgi:hypothetical protein